MNYAPWTGLGQLQGELESLKQQLHQKAYSYELSTLSLRMDRLEHSVWEIRSALDELRVQLSLVQTHPVGPITPQEEP